MKKIFFSLCIIALSVSCSLRAQDNVVIAEQFIQALVAQQYEDAAKLFAQEMTQINSGVLESAWEQLNTIFGNYQSHYIIPADKDASSVIAGIRFSKETKGFNCNFNDSHQLVGFLLTALPETQQDSAGHTVSSSIYKEEDLSIQVEGGTIYGTLLLPEKHKKSYPTALIIPGSGPTDRNGNNYLQLSTNAYKMLAEALAEKGIASFRYDKRLIGASNGFVQQEADLRFEDYVNDAIAICNFLKADKSAGKLYIIGHSEGSLTGTLAAQKVKTDAFISLCGIGENLAATIERQLPGERIKEITDQLKQGKMAEDVPDSLLMIFRPSVQPYLISMMRYDPATELKKLNIPVLIVAGTTDIQIPVADAKHLKEATSSAELAIIDGMNHILKNAPAGALANQITYTQPSLPLHTELVKKVTTFLQKK